MLYWQSGTVFTLLLLAVLLLLGSLLTRVGPLGRLGIPVSIVAGVLGLALGPDVVGFLPLDRDLLELVVYHGLGIVFIAVTLMDPPAGRRGGGALSIAFAVPFMGSLQGLTGLISVLLLGLATGAVLHPAFGILLPYGFEQGPGQALAIGSAWEQSFGMPDGAQVGLIIAAAGFAWAIIFGIPLVAWGKRRGLLSPPVAREEEASAETLAERLSVGSLELLTQQLVAIGAVYLATYGLIVLVTRLLAGMPDIANMLWGFHYIVGALLALPTRALLKKYTVESPLNDELLGRINGFTVDVVTCAALAAIQIAVFRAHWLPILVVTSLGGLLTLLGAVWVSKRSFPDEPFEHGLLLFGMATGTVPMGFALLRMVDPELRGSVPSSCVIGSVGTIPISAPLYLFIMPFAVTQWGGNYPMMGWVGVGLILTYLVVLVAAWRLVGPLSFKRPLLALWPPDEPPVEAVSSD
ncbi:MAG: hypothetical protein JRI25_05105 [Deltaproteobacteria bacterium]|nr:hypothetical protein [Deltaproteobacteria bacterium]